ncbi:hypothetical protein OAC89_07230, partial [Deltaproteobacteria bacterium]|nr:hypothetical protein [Deltaproteobacteria bacterium]
LQLFIFLWPIFPFKIMKIGGILKGLMDYKCLPLLKGRQSGSKYRISTIFANNFHFSAKIVMPNSYRALISS